MFHALSLALLCMNTLITTPTSICGFYLSGALTHAASTTRVSEGEYLFLRPAEVIIMGIKQVSASNCYTGETLSCNYNLPAFIWLPR